MNRRYLRTALRANSRCEYCLAPEAASTFPFEVEHIVPVIDEGGDDASNLALACRSCNLFKSSFRTGIDPDSGRMIRLFHPRTDVWDDHFVFDVASLEIRGRTPVGRATVSRLKLNTEWQFTARRLWIKANAFPP